MEGQRQAPGWQAENGGLEQQNTVSRPRPPSSHATPPAERDLITPLTQGGGKRLDAATMAMVVVVERGGVFVAGPGVAQSITTRVDDDTGDVGFDGAAGRQVSGLNK